VRVFGNRVLRRIFRPKRDEVRGERRKLHSEELHNLYTSTNTLWYYQDNRIKEDEMGGECSAYGGDEKCAQNFSWEVWRRDHS
jgi:hypothetical protein